MIRILHFRMVKIATETASRSESCELNLRPSSIGTIPILKRRLELIPLQHPPSMALPDCHTHNLWWGGWLTGRIVRAVYLCVYICFAFLLMVINFRVLHCSPACPEPTTQEKP